MRLFKRYVSARGLTAFAFEILLIAGSLLIATRLHAPADDADLVWRVALATGLFLVCLYFNDFYDLTIVHSTGEIIVRLLQAGGAASIILAAVYFVIPEVAVRERAFFPSLALFLALTLMWRLVFNAVSQTRGLAERVLIIGTDTAAQAVARQIASQHDFAYRLVGFVDDAPAEKPAENLPRHAPVLGGTKDIGYLVARHDINRIVIAVSDRRGHLPVNELVRVKLSGVRIEDASTTYERLSGKILLENLKPSLFVFSDGFYVSAMQRFLKRAVDVTLSFVGLVVGVVPMLLTALAVYLESGAPVLYRQERVGEHGRTFTLFKFRSMRIDAEGATPVWATEHDDRVTKVGRFIRTTRLDELPQLWNVLRGEMSFVGPRPERKYFVEMLVEQIPFYHQRHAVKPGVTGWAQIKYRYGASVEDATEKLRYDLYYIKHLSVFFDLTIVFDTLKVIVSGKGAQ
jgi:sugar transferase (PEP-CTERM system associated)